MEDLSQSDQVILWAVQNGYHYKNNRIVSPRNNIKKYRDTNSGYYVFSFRPRVEQYPKRRVFSILVHRLIGYLKFKEKIFDPLLLIRHLDGNQKNNNWDNLEIGTYSDNMMDKSAELRMRQSLQATIHTRKFNDQEIIAIREDSKIHGLSYNQIMVKWNISSKGTLSYIINHQYKTKKD